MSFSNILFLKKYLSYLNMMRKLLSLLMVRGQPIILQKLVMNIIKNRFPLKLILLNLMLLFVVDVLIILIMDGTLDVSNQKKLSLISRPNVSTSDSKLLLDTSTWEEEKNPNSNTFLIKNSSQVFYLKNYITVVSIYFQLVMMLTQPVSAVNQLKQKKMPFTISQ